MGRSSSSAAHRATIGASARERSAAFRLASNLSLAIVAIDRSHETVSQNVTGTEKSRKPTYDGSQSKSSLAGTLQARPASSRNKTHWRALQ